MTETASSARLPNPVPVLRGSGRLCLAVALLVCTFPVTGNLHAQAPKPTEYEVEAAYLSNFGRFVEWPARVGAGQTNNDPFYVCVLGQDPFGSLLDGALRGETIGGGPMVAKRISGPEDAAGCRILFVSSSRDSQLNAILTALGTSNILTVGEMPGFTRRGGMIQFVLDGNRVRFEINLAAAQRAGLTLSSELLKVAVAVRRAP
jgi:hypothetical protein